MTASTQAYPAVLALLLTAVLIGAVLQTPARTGSASRDAYQSTGLRIDVNSADAATLTLLPGIGPGIADHIIQARQGGMVFHNVDDLEAIRFIGPKLITRIGPWVVFGSDTGTGDSAASLADQVE